MGQWVRLKEIVIAMNRPPEIRQDRFNPQALDIREMPEISRIALHLT